MSSKLFVGNLPHSITDVQLNEFVIDAGIQVASAVVIRDKLTGTPRGFGFVELGEGEDIQRAIAGLNGKTLDGRTLTVNEAKPQSAGFGRPQSRGGRSSNGNSGRGGCY
jgi:RNA recognition motif-containing protein